MSRTATLQKPKTRPVKESPPPVDQPQPKHLGIRIQSIPLMALLLAGTLLMMSLIHAPIDQWYLAYVCMVPWLVVVGGTAIANRVYVASWVLGFAYFLINMYWMEVPTGMGYVALSAYLACYFPLAACPIRHAVRRRRIPLSVAMPLVWIGVEFARGLVISGFPWFFLGHSQYATLPMIQISDLVGAYGVSFVIAAINGGLADLIFAKYGNVPTDHAASQRQRAYKSLIFAVALAVFTLGYGFFRLSQDTITDGPNIALLQQYYPNYADPESAAKEAGPEEKMLAYFELMAAAGKENPDLYLFPESAWYMHLNQEFLEMDTDALHFQRFARAKDFSLLCYNELRNWAITTNTHIVVGSTTRTPTPLSLRQRDDLRNSAFHFTPSGEQPKRHDKVHPVLFGERVPFRYGRLRFLYLWLNSLSPFGSSGHEYSITPGEEVQVFDMKTGDQTYHFGVPICYEDVMPYVCRRIAWDSETNNKRVDFLLNISNDGWFGKRNEQEQHFAICTFRAVENRVGVARTVNTGVSGFIDPNGRAYGKIPVGEVDYVVDRVKMDSRTSLYSRIGDIFAILCSVVAVLLYIDYIAVRMRPSGETD